MQKKVFTLDDFDFDLPSELIAQYPEKARDESRLFVLERGGAHVHTTFTHLPEFLRAGDVLVFNDARVISARIPCKRESGGALEMLLTGRVDETRWTAITNRTKRCRTGEIVCSVADPCIRFKITGKRGGILELESSRALGDGELDAIGNVALPPYIKRDSMDADRERYQTVYARESGAIAAPTAGLHFTEALLGAIREMGAATVFLTLHVSWGTFQPVRDNDITRHRMHSERYALSGDAAGVINGARRSKNRVIAVGTTALRVLEATCRDGVNVPGSGETDIFIYPPRKATAADGLITNFHTPRSTLLMLAASFAGYDTIMSAYREAVNMGYRFFSYGDSMFII